jgi:secondary thiamine-phosphate synthase enzyme
MQHAWQNAGMIPYSAVHERLAVHTRGKGTYEITADVERLVRSSGIRTGTATVFVRHTSASLVTYENADPSARHDLHAWLDKIAPEDEKGSPLLT